ncbi:MAG: hypothetical protein JW768_13200 [Chitinispirillaceae bacterium]|nr:hypothetical protein [Chitinispirillaceae bacterium]
MTLVEKTAPPVHHNDFFADLRACFHLVYKPFQLSIRQRIIEKPPFPREDCFGASDPGLHGHPFPLKIVPAMN